MVTSAAELSWSGLEDTSANCLTVSWGRASVCSTHTTHIITTDNIITDTITISWCNGSVCSTDTTTDTITDYCHRTTGQQTVTTEKVASSLCMSLKEAKAENPLKFFSSQSPLFRVSELQLGSGNTQTTQLDNTFRENTIRQHI